MPSIDSERRALLAGVAGLAGFAGCLDGHTDEQTVPLTDSPETPVTSDGPTATESSTPAGQFSLTPIDPADAAGELTVYPEDLREWLRTAATTDETIRDDGSSTVYPVRQEYEPMPPLTAFDRVRLDDHAASADDSSTYDLDADGGVRYKLLVGAEEADPPDAAEVTPVSDLPEQRQELVLAAIGAPSDRDARVYPETELGSWVRAAFFDGYVAHEGTVYRGHEIQQTDVAFRSARLWYVLSLSAAAAESAPVTLRLADVGETARAVVDDLRSEHETIERMGRRVEGETAAAVERFAAEHSLLLTHDAVFRVRYE